MFCDLHESSFVDHPKLQHTPDLILGPSAVPWSLTGTSRTVCIFRKTNMFVHMKQVALSAVTMLTLKP